MARILIIDDEERNRRLFEVFVKADGHDALFASNGPSGLQLAQSEAPDLILLDLMMPGMDGFEVTRNLKAKSVTQKIPIIVVSSLDDIASRQRMIAIGIDEFIVKPIDRWELSRKMTELLKSATSNASASTSTGNG